MYGSGKTCNASPVNGYPFCQRHLEIATVRDIALVRGGDVTFADIRGQRVENPLEALADLVSEVLTYKDYCAMQVAKLRGDERYEGKSGEQLRAEVALYERSLDRAGKLLIEWSRLNIDERLTRIEEAKAAMILTIVRSAFNAAELSPEQLVRAENEVVRGLRALENG